jgi:hypothetical protein
MRLAAKKYLHDIHQAADLVAEFTAGKQFADYERDAMLRAAVERQFEIIGEALAQLARLDEALASRISEHAAYRLPEHKGDGGRPGAPQPATVPVHTAP